MALTLVSPATYCSGLSVVVRWKWILGTPALAGQRTVSGVVATVLLLAPPWRPLN
jgi:hypothetical protein